MKKHTLKRYLASLLAVLMLISVAGISPAVFADDTTPPQLVETSAANPKEVLIKSTYSNEQVLNALADALFTNADQVDAQSQSWTYTCEGSGNYKYYQITNTGDRTATNNATGSIFGFTSTKSNVEAYTYKKVKIDVTCNHPALAANNDGAYTLYLNGQAVCIKKVAKLTSSVNVANDNIDVALPYNADGSVNEDQLHKLIFDAAGVTTTPEGLTYDQLSYSGTVAEGTQSITIAYAGNEEYYGSSAPITVNFTDSRAVAFTTKEYPETLKIGYVGNDVDVDKTIENIRKQLVNQESDLSLDNVKVEYYITVTAFGKTTVVGGYDELTKAAIIASEKLDIGYKSNIRLTYAGDANYKPYTDDFTDIKFADYRVASSIAIKADASITYNMKADVMKQDIFDNVIDWDNSTLPAKDTLTVNDFKFECKSGLLWKDIAGDEYPLLDAGDGQTIRISFVGNSEYKPCNDKEATINVAKADVAVSMNKFTKAYAGEEEDLTIEKLGITLDPNDPRIDIYRIFAGINTNLNTSVNLVLTDEQWDVIVKISKVQAYLYEKAPKLFPNYDGTLQEKLQKGMTIGEFKALIAEIIDAIDKAEDIPFVGDGVKALLESLNIDLDSIKTMATVFDKLTQFTDDTTIALGVPQHAGLYRVYAVAVHKNYNTSYASGTVLILMNWKNMKIVPNEELKGHTITLEQAKEYGEDGDKAAATLKCGDTAVKDQSSLHYRYTGLTTIYSSHDFPTKAGKYIVTVSVRGGDYYALPTTFTFTIK